MVVQYVKEVFQENWQILTRMDKRQFIQQVVSLGLVICSALMIWKGLMFVTNSESPIVVVLSGSMEPGFQRGDLLFLTFHEENDAFKVGDIVVFKVEGREIPIVHRVISAHTDKKDNFFLLTKGDNNQVDDRPLYTTGQLWLERKHILGRAKGYLPYVGMVTIIMNDYPYVKYLLIGFLGLLVLTNKE
jgi:signal peptidase|uniref:Signal peptidase complex catalytic subunit SEC11 n=1 Tax=Eutreptiella gymnastica TaxID=73025 RepID=A0A7S4GJF7_9EUGL|mmetsp:Transcript_47070/g.78894  ORF Transcript_47070/g.78894 Transcript_47070/m.78894 type:complete len:188 (+) Transcript_47070:126-689(+)